MTVNPRIINLPEFGMLSDIVDINFDLEYLPLILGISKGELDNLVIKYLEKSLNKGKLLEVNHPTYKYDSRIFHLFSSGYTLRITEFDSMENLDYITTGEMNALSPINIIHQKVYLLGEEKPLPRILYEEDIRERIAQYIIVFVGSEIIKERNIDKTQLKIYERLSEQNIKNPQLN